MWIGIVGSEQAKFTALTEESARRTIRKILSDPMVTGVVSGKCHLGGIDLYAAEIGRELFGESGVIEHPPKRQTWAGGYRERNVLIANDSAEVYCLTIETLPAGYKGMRFPLCYHCGTNDHVKSGGCWTMRLAMRQRKPGHLIVIRASGSKWARHWLP